MFDALPGLTNDGFAKSQKAKNLNGGVGMNRFLVWTIGFTGVVASHNILGSSLDEWIGAEFELAEKQLLLNVSPAGAEGAVIASPSTERPDYFYYWVRDAALVMNTVVATYEETGDPDLLKKLVDYVEKSRVLQVSKNRSGEFGLGEPKFLADGSVFNGDWERPQNDGPALRTITLIHLSEVLKAKQIAVTFSDGTVISADDFGRYIFDGARPVIKSDLDYLAGIWKHTSGDLWEENNANHFYTRMTQRKALLDGARFIALRGDTAQARDYAEAAKGLSVELRKHWKADRGYVVASGTDWKITLDPSMGENKKNKTTNLDISVILAALHADIFQSVGHSAESYFGVTDDRILATAVALNNSFASLYEINQASWIKEFVPEDEQPLGTAMGRYPEDVYDGGTENGDPQGNPWVLATAAMAELNYRVAEQWGRYGFVVTELNQKFIRLVSKNVPAIGTSFGPLKEKPESAAMISDLKSAGDSYLRRIRFHTPRPGDANEGHLSEQFSRSKGNMLGARDLTWSYASFITAKRARDSIPSPDPAKPAR
jgi:glucoamylase